MEHMLASGAQFPPGTLQYGTYPVQWSMPGSGLAAPPAQMPWTPEVYGATPLVGLGQPMLYGSSSMAAPTGPMPWTAPTLQDRPQYPPSALTPEQSAQQLAAAIAEASQMPAFADPRPPVPAQPEPPRPPPETAERLPSHRAIPKESRKRSTPQLEENTDDDGIENALDAALEASMAPMHIEERKARSPERGVIDGPEPDRERRPKAKKEKKDKRHAEGGSGEREPDKSRVSRRRDDASKSRERKAKRSRSRDGHQRSISRQRSSSLKRSNSRHRSTSFKDRKSRQVSADRKESSSRKRSASPKNNRRRSKSRRRSPSPKENQRRHSSRSRSRKRNSRKRSKSRKAKWRSRSRRRSKQRSRPRSKAQSKQRSRARSKPRSRQRSVHRSEPRNWQRSRSPPLKKPKSRSRSRRAPAKDSAISPQSRSRPDEDNLRAANGSTPVAPQGSVRIEQDSASKASGSDVSAPKPHEPHHPLAEDGTAVTVSSRRRTKWDDSGDGKPNVPDWLQDLVPRPEPKAPPGITPDKFKVLMMDAQQLRALIGRGGETSQDIRNKSGAEIKVDAGPSDGTGRVTIVGEVEVCEKLIREILTARGCPLGGTQQLALPAAPSATASLGLGTADSREVPVPGDLIGQLIGPGGATINELRAEAGGGVFITILPPATLGGEQSARISGSPLGVAQAEVLLRRKLDELRRVISRPGGTPGSGPATSPVQVAPPPPPPGMLARQPMPVLPPAGSPGFQGSQRGCANYVARVVPPPPPPPQRAASPPGTQPCPVEGAWRMQLPFAGQTGVQVPGQGAVSGAVQGVGLAGQAPVHSPGQFLGPLAAQAPSPTPRGAPGKGYALVNGGAWPATAPVSAIMGRSFDANMVAGATMPAAAVPQLTASVKAGPCGSLAATGASAKCSGLLGCGAICGGPCQAQTLGAPYFMYNVPSADGSNGLCRATLGQATSPAEGWHVSGAAPSAFLGPPANGQMQKWDAFSEQMEGLRPSELV